MTSYIYNMVDTWNNGATTFTAIKMNVTDTASNASSLLMDLQVGATSKFSVNKGGVATGTGFYVTSGGNSAVAVSSLATYGYHMASDYSVTWGSSAILNGSIDLSLTRRGAANLRFGAADAAAPVAQTLSVQSVVAGTSNTAGANLTITGSQGTGTGAGGSIIFQVAPAGSSGSAQNALATALTIGQNDINLTLASGRFFIINDRSGNNTGLWVHASTGGIGLASGGYLLWSNSATNSFGTPDLILLRDAANTLAQRNATAAQRFNVYNTWTSSTNYEAFKIDWITTANTVLVGTEKGSGGGTARALEFQTDGTTRLSFSADNSLCTVSSTNLITGSQIRLSNSTRIINSSSGVFRVTDSSEADFGRLQFGGTTSSFPSLKRSSTTLQARLADDSAFASVQGKLTTDTAYTAGAIVATGYLTLYDSTGTAYRVPCVV